jgi:murein DD-endopeptidase MepM/ murein hydrolase activator NlpD
MFIVRWFFGLLLIALVALGATYWVAGRASGPVIAITVPPVVGQAAPLEIAVEAPGGNLDALSVQLEQAGRSFPIFTLGAGSAAAKKEGDRVRIAQTIGKSAVPQLQPGTATVVVSATRPVMRGLRHISSRAAKDVQLRFDPPRIGVVSTKHYVNVGGSEMVVYRVTPADARSGVRVGDFFYPGFAASGAGVAPDPALKVAFFALLYDQPTTTPIELYARDEAGNEARAQFEHQVFPKKFKHSKIPLDDGFLGRVVPAILQHSPELGLPAGATNDLLPSFLKINGDLRKLNAQKIAGLAAKTSPTLLWKGAFLPLTGSQVEAAFADFRTYTYRGKEVDNQVHLGFDLAKIANAPIAAANDGHVLYADDLGIYGNCVILDHGMGVQSLYAHLSSFQVKEGDTVRKGQTIGLTGETGLAGGDHLHFSMLVNGQFVNATEWWDPHWLQDRIMRKLAEAGAAGATVAP